MPDNQKHRPGAVQYRASGNHASDSPRHPPQQPVKKPFHRSGSAKLLMLGLAVIAILSFALVMNLGVGTKLIRGITINGLDVGGMTPAVAKEKLTKLQRPYLDALTVTLQFEGKQWTKNAPELGPSLDLDLVVDEAMKLGHTGEESVRRDEINRVRRDGAVFQTKIYLDDAKFTGWMQEIAPQVSIPGSDATVTFDPALGEEKMFQITDEVPGKELDAEATKQQILEALQHGTKVNIAPVVKPVTPQMTREKLQQSTQLLSTFETSISYSSSKERVDNIKLSISKFNGKIIMPGEELSFNETTGERSEANGYQMAPSINRDKQLENSLGGGVCQSSTTVYNAALLAGCKIIERNRHSFPSTYVKKGFDAMVNWGTSDLKFSNQSEGPIFIRTEVEKNKLRVFFYGMPIPDGMICERSWEILLEEEAPEPEVRVDTKGEYAEFFKNGETSYVVVDSHKGLKVQTYRLWKKGDEVITKEPLFLDYYKPIKGLHYVPPEVVLPTATVPPEEVGDTE